MSDIDMAARNLKVFKAQFGFYDTVVAASSQTAALRAWGVHQNLFASGEAEVTEEADAVTAALAHPEVPLRRAVGTIGAFELEPKTLPTMLSRPPSAGRKAAKAARIRKSPPDRADLDAAAGVLSRLEEAYREEEGRFGRRQEDLIAEKAAAKNDYIQRRRDAEATLHKARIAFQDAGGEVGSQAQKD